ncbi:hypothetical protein [Metabacillus sp. 84]|uniref:hypothetical protein n=1 Tax=unclassified Metabacillus TaxID=2675274 RepID=UPI003CE7E4E0
MNFKTISPTCPRCSSLKTYDIIPGIREDDQLARSEESLIQMSETSLGNADYQCRDCGHRWKKYTGQKPYDTIQRIYADAGGYPGPFHSAFIDLKGLMAESSSRENPNSSPAAEFRRLKQEEAAWFREELYASDFMNWAEEYMLPFALDGTHWTIRIEYDTYCEIKSGHIHTPPGWERFCMAVSSLSGQAFY